MIAPRSFIVGGIGAVVLVVLAGFLRPVLWPAAAGGSGSVPAGNPSAGAESDNAASESRDPDGSAKPAKYPAGIEATARPGSIALPDDSPVSCPPATITVRTPDELAAALAGAGPGTVIGLADGSYPGNFTAAAAGAADQPIYLCGSRAAVLDAGGPKEGYVLHLDGARYWRLVGFTVSNGQKGVMGDGVVGSVIQHLHVTGTGDEAVHLRNFSSDNLVVDNDIDTTGLRRDKFGEGVYIGTAVSNWCTITECQPDRSDRNVVIGNRISNTGSESVDIKEGTTGGAVRGNTFDGTGMTGADSWVDIKGNAWVIDGNNGTHSPLDGFQTHHILDAWGNWNVFSGNTADVDADGYGYALRPAADNVLSCDNTASGAGSGTADVACVPH